MKAKVNKNNLSVLKNKLVIVPAALLITLLSAVAGTKYESQIKTILNQPSVNQGEQKILPKEGVVQRVIDGDTIVLENGSTIRYVGITTPERNESFWQEATNENKKLVEGKKVKLEYDAYTSDKFGRVLAYVIVDNKNISIELVKKGLAKVVIMEKRRELIHQEELLKAQEEAKEKKLGIWKE